MKTKTEISVGATEEKLSRIDELERIVSVNNYWLNKGMSNPIKISQRKKAIRLAEQELQKLK